MARATGVAIAAEIEGEHKKSCGSQGAGLWGPALLVELASMGEDNAVVAMSIEVREDDSTVFGGEGDRFLRVRGKSDHEGGEDGDPCAHAAYSTTACGGSGRMGTRRASPQVC